MVVAEEIGERGTRDSTSRVSDSNERGLSEGRGGGVIHGSTCEAIVCTLAAAWDKAFKKIDCRFEVVVPRKFALVCFRLKNNPGKLGDDLSKLNRRLLESVNASGRAFMTHAVVGGTYMLRCVIGTTMTEKRHVEGFVQRINTQIVEDCRFEIVVPRKFALICLPLKSN
ncbi:hypothetical protein GIB67_025219 [Kingdonia uniflora]|uniref:Uncharacterized protein n=1 Tax=Kingdonia uniflora TaxID=39325 RepID=A0A7J7N881_9MAGN|nr:hypothetical protein GIB67_025219 [Kingdonia uniflora]